MSDLPSEVHREILLRLPAESLIRFRTVCKAWCTIIDDRSFVKSHTDNQLSSTTLLIRNKTGALLYSLNLESLIFTTGVQSIPVTPVEQLVINGVLCVPKLPVAACHGLFLLQGKDEIIWNPLTNEYLKLPAVTDSPSYVEGRGLGYDSATDDYKVVAIGTDGLFQNMRERRTHVYSLKSDTWRLIANCPSKGPVSPGVFLNGKLYWRSVDTIIVFDLGTENYEELELPELPSSREVDYMVHLDALGGYLFLSYYYYMINCFELWVKDDSGAEDLWLKLFSFNDIDDICYASDLRPVAFLKNKKQIFLQGDCGIFWLHIGSYTVKKVIIHGASSSQICPGSLFRLHDSCGVRGRDKRRANRRRRRQGKMKVPDSMLTYSVRCIGVWYDSHRKCFTSDSSSSDSEDPDMGI